MSVSKILGALGVKARLDRGKLQLPSPIDGAVLGHLTAHTRADIDRVLGAQVKAAQTLRSIPAPKRGELIRVFGDVLREHKADLAALVTLEAGKITAEAEGEVQEMIDICDFACGLSRQLYGLTIASERPGHRMMETWHPLGVVGVISAFNFPVAVWAWNFALAVVAGNSVVWKPSEKTLLCALGCQALFEEAARRYVAAGGSLPSDISAVLLGDAKVGAALAEDPRVALVSATGSTRMGRAVAPKVAARFGRVLLELGGNNAMIVTPSADLDLAVRAIVFSAAGTCGQRCTSLRRLIVHKSVHAELTTRLKKAFAQLRVGDPRSKGTLVGPLVDKASYERMQDALARAKKAGGKVSGGKRVSVKGCENGFYVEPALVLLKSQADIMKEETFAPILYVVPYTDLAQAVHMQNDVPQGLSSCIFTTNVREAELFVSSEGSDCGIANVNIGPSGAEIGGAFGGEKETGGGRESGSDAWRNYMRRATNTVNYSTDLPLAQGITFA